VHYWADMQSVHGLHCYGNITRMLNVSECMLVLTLCLVITVIIIQLMYNMFLQVFDERKALVGKWVSFALYQVHQKTTLLLKVLVVNAFCLSVRRWSVSV